jgi:hypothetical protein
MVTHTQVVFPKNSETIGVRSVALLENGVEKCGSLAVYAKSLDLENDLNEAVGDREYEIDHCESRKCNALPQKLQIRADKFHDEKMAGLCSKRAEMPLGRGLKKDSDQDSSGIVREQ